MRRRELMLLLGGAMTAAGALRAQQKAMPVIGFLGGGSPGPNAPVVTAFHQGLSEAGYVEGQNVTIEYRWAEGRYDRLPALAADLVGRKIDLIATAGGTVSTLAAKNATSTIPIVFAGNDDPVGNRPVASLSRPGGNVTGFSIFSFDLVSKRLELLSELVPQAGVIALLVDPINSNAERIIGDAQEAARAKGVQLHILKAATESEIDAAFASLVQFHASALVVTGFFSRREPLVALAARYAVLAMYDGAPPAAWSAMERASPACIAKLELISARFSREPSPPTCQFSSQLSSSWLSLSRPPRRLASPCRNRSSPGPTRSSNERPLCVASVCSHAWRPG